MLKYTSVKIAQYPSGVEIYYILGIKILKIKRFDMRTKTVSLYD